MKTIGALFVSCLLLPVAYLLIGLDAWAGASRNILFELFFISFGILVAVLAFRLGGKKVF